MIKAGALPLPERISLVFLALLCSAPFLQPYHLNPLTAFHSEWLALVCGLGVSIVLAGARAWRAAELPWIALSPVALAVLLFAHGALGWSPYFGQGLTAALYLLWAALLAAAVHALARSCGRHAVLDTAAAGLAAGALLSAFAGLLQHLRYPTVFDHVISRSVGSGIYGNLAQTNHFASYTTLGLVAAAYLCLRGRLGLKLLAAAALPMLFVLGLSGSRAALLYLLALFAAAAWRRRRGDDPSDKRLFAICAAYLAGYLLLQQASGAGWFGGAGHEVVTALDRFSSGAASIQDRLRLWQGAWTLFLAHPLWGGGWGSFALGFFDQAATLFPDGGYKLYNNAHNIVLHLLAETGIAGPACLALPAVLAWRGRGEVRDSHVLLFAAGVATVLLLHSLLEYPLWYAYFLAPAALVCGVLPLGVCRLSMARLWRLLAGTLLLGSSINLVVLWRDYRLFESVFWMRAAPERREELAGIMVRLHRNPLLRHYVEMAYTLPMRLNESELTGQLYANSRAMHFVPLDTLVYRQVLLLTLADRGDEAVALLARARAAWPVPPEEYRTDLKRLSSSQPARFAPLLESASRRTPAQP